MIPKKTPWWSMMSMVDLFLKFRYGGPQIWSIGQKCSSEKWRTGLSKSPKSKLLVQIESDMAQNDTREVPWMRHEVKRSYFLKTFVWRSSDVDYRPKMLLLKGPNGFFQVSKIQTHALIRLKNNFEKLQGGNQDDTWFQQSILTQNVGMGVPKFKLSAKNAALKSDGRTFSSPKLKNTGSNLLKYG